MTQAVLPKTDLVAIICNRLGRLRKEGKIKEEDEC